MQSKAFQQIRASSENAVQTLSETTDALKRPQDLQNEYFHPAGTPMGEAIDTLKSLHKGIPNH